MDQSEQLCIYPLSLPTLAQLFGEEQVKRRHGVVGEMMTKVVEVGAYCSQ